MWKDDEDGEKVGQVIENTHKKGLNMCRQVRIFLSVSKKME